MVTNVFLRTVSTNPVPTLFQGGLVLDVFADAGRSTVAANFSRFADEVGALPPHASDVLLLSAAMYVADKKVPRRHAPDRWTREFRVSVPVHDPAAWQAATPSFEEALEFLTGDRWALEWRHGATEVGSARPGERRRADVVCLFSGGLDSLIGAIDLLEGHPDARLLLVGHYDSSLTPGVQRLLAEELKALYGSERVRLVQAFVRPASTRAGQEFPLPTGREITTRSRSIAFIGLGLAAAAAQSPTTPLYVPENGFIAVNTPLTDARLGSCSTRTTHPYFFDRLRSGLDAVGLANPIINPYLLSTKGEMLARCRNQDLLARLAGQSVSCAHPEQGRYEQTGYGNCGYCFPCLIRRAALNAVGLDEPSHYRRDVCADGSLLHGQGVRGRDARAVFAALGSGGDPARSGTLAPVLAGPLPNLRPRDVARVHRQGLEELRQLFDAKMVPEVRRVAGLP